MTTSNVIEMTCKQSRVRKAQQAQGVVSRALLRVKRRCDEANRYVCMYAFSMGVCVGLLAAVAMRGGL